MTNLAAALNAEQLTPYKGRDVLRTSIAIRNAGDGLSQAMGIDPVEYPIDSRVFVVLECTVAGHDYKPIKDTDCLELKQVFRAGTATIVDGAIVQSQITAQAEKIKVAREQAKGIDRLPLGAQGDGGEFEEEGEATVLRTHHEAGLHAGGLVEGCPACDLEKAAIEAEANNGKPKGRGRKGASS